MSKTNTNHISNDLDEVSILKKSLGMFATGITVVTTIDEDKKPIGMTVNSFASVSLNPSLVLWSIEKNQPSYKKFLNSDGYAVNILTKDQIDLCSHFSSPIENKFKNVNWKPSENGYPLIQDALAWFDCVKWNDYDGGDHQILVGEVKSHDFIESEPLIYWNSKIS